MDASWDHGSGCFAPRYEEGHAAIGARVFNTHLLWHMMPRSATSQARYIYVVRDGRDVVTSFFHHLSNQANAGGFEGTFEEFFDAWLDGSLPYGRWADHVRSWFLGVTGAAADRVLFVCYEDLKADLSSQLRRVASFLGLHFTAPEVR